MKKPSIQDLKAFKHKKGDPRNFWFDGVSTYVVKLLLHTPITPLQVNATVTIVGICMGLCFTAGTLPGRIVGVMLFFLYIILDAVDGQLARARDDCTLKGAYLDKMGHYVVYPFVSAAIGYGNYLTTGETIVLWAGFVIGIAKTLSSASRDCFKAIYGDAAGEAEQVSHVRSEFLQLLKRIVHATLRFESMLYLVLLTSLVDRFCLPFEIPGLNLNIESFVIVFYAIGLLSLNVFKVYLFFSRERLVSG